MKKSQGPLRKPLVLTSEEAIIVLLAVSDYEEYARKTWWSKSEQKKLIATIRRLRRKLRKI